MATLILGKITIDDIKQNVLLQESGIQDYEWLRTEGTELSEDEKAHLGFINGWLTREPLHLLNEATIWSRAIYPLLVLAEQGDIRARAQVSMSAEYPEFSITGVADGVIGKAIAERIIAPYLVVIEAKRGIGGEDPIPQLYGQLLAAAKINQTSNDAPLELFGCYTVADTWTFIRAVVSGLNTHPTLTVEYSSEFSQRYDAEGILKTLKLIVNRQLHKSN